MSNGLRSVLSFVRSMLNKSRIWSLQLFSFLVGLRTYQHPLVDIFVKIVNAISCDNRKEELLQVHAVAVSFS